MTSLDCWSHRIRSRGIPRCPGSTTLCAAVGAGFRFGGDINYGTRPPYNPIDRSIRPQNGAPKMESDGILTNGNAMTIADYRVCS